MGTVSYGDRTVELSEGDTMSFGRAPDATLQIGSDPIVDTLVARYAGSIHAAFGRLVVLNTNESLALDVCVPGRPPVAVSPGAVFAPAEECYQVRVAGSLIYRIDVRVTARSGPQPADSRLRPEVELTDRQRDMLDAYVEPIIDGDDAATHQEVADRLNISRSLVRLECSKIHEAMLRAGIPLRNYADTRDVIVDAWVRHRI